VKKIFVLFSLGVLFLTAVPGYNAAAKDVIVEKGKKVKLDYTLKIDGEVIETSQKDKPLEYIHGSGALIPGLESQLQGLRIGNEKKIIIDPKNGYGEFIPDAFKEFKLKDLPADFTAKQGLVVSFKDDEENIISGIIWEIKDNAVVVNFNHPLAGKTLEFNVKIVGIE